MNIQENQLQNDLINQINLGTKSLNDLSHKEIRSLLKTPSYDKNGDMIFESGHKTFDRQTNCISSGNCLANTMTSLYIRAYNDVTLYGGDEAKKGELQKFDLKSFRYHDNFYTLDNFIKRLDPDEVVIVHSFFHHTPQRRIYHGFIITDQNQVRKATLYTGPTHKSAQILDEAARYVAIEKSLFNN